MTIGRLKWFYHIEPPLIALISSKVKRLILIGPLLVVYFQNMMLIIFWKYTYILQFHEFHCNLYLLNTVRCRYNAVNFLQNSRKTHHISPVKRAMVNLLKIESQIYIMTVTAVMHAISCYIEPRYNGTELNYPASNAVVPNTCRSVRCVLRCDHSCMLMRYCAREKTRKTHN